MGGDDGLLDGELAAREYEGLQATVRCCSSLLKLTAL